jgi:hypothetical protein
MADFKKIKYHVKVYVRGMLLTEKTFRHLTHAHDYFLVESKKILDAGPDGPSTRVELVAIRINEGW